MNVHEYAKFFPPIEGEEFAALVQDIREHGLLEPIVILDDKILDGRNRYRACEKAGVKPKFEKYRGNGALEYVVSKNVKRRHLTKDQLGVIAQDMLPAFEKEAAERSRANLRDSGRHARPVGSAGESTSHVAKVLGISGDVVKRVKRVSKEAPELIAEIRAGSLTAYQAEQQVRAKKAKELAKKITDIKETRKRQENPREVKEHLEAVRAFISALKTAKRVADYGKFSPEAARFTREKYRAVRDLMKEVEASLG